VYLRLSDLKKIEKYARENRIPIMVKGGINFLKAYIKKNNIKEILEIGTAIGYSAIQMALVDKDIHVTTIERDEERYLEAIKNIQDFGLDNQITVILDDAFNVNLKGKYDLIFIDAAKAQYIKFFEKFKINLKDGGVIISDNLKFHGLVTDDITKYSKNVQGLIRHLREYLFFLKNNDEFETKIASVGDGIAVSKRREDN